MEGAGHLVKERIDGIMQNDGSESSIRLETFMDGTCLVSIDGNDAGKTEFWAASISLERERLCDLIGKLLYALTVMG